MPIKNENPNICDTGWRVKRLWWHFTKKIWVSASTTQSRPALHPPVFPGQSRGICGQCVFHLPVQTHAWVWQCVPSAPVIFHSWHLWFLVVMTGAFIRLAPIFIDVQNNTRFITGAIPAFLIIKCTFISYHFIVCVIVDLTCLVKSSFNLATAGDILVEKLLCQDNIMSVMKM